MVARVVAELPDSAELPLWGDGGVSAASSRLGDADWEEWASAAASKADEIDSEGRKAVRKDGTKVEGHQELDAPKAATLRKDMAIHAKGNCQNRP